MYSNIRIFIGGSGRCGTTILGRVLEEINSSIYFIEPRIIPPNQGIHGLLQGKITFDTFKNNVLKIFSERTISSFKDNKNHCKDYNVKDDFYSKDVLIPLLAKLESDVQLGALAFVRSYIDIGLKYFNTTCFICKTPNLIYSPNLVYQLYDNSLFLHIIREPKDVYESVLNYPRNTDIKNPIVFSNWYYRKMCSALTAYRHIDKSRYKVITLESLVNNSSIIVRSILNRVGIDNEDLVASCCKHINPADAHINKYLSNINILNKAAEYDYVDKHCEGIYNAWLRVSNSIV